MNKQTIRTDFESQWVPPYIRPCATTKVNLGNDLMTSDGVRVSKVDEETIVHEFGS